MQDKGVYMEIITPMERFYSGEVEMLIVKTLNGQEGFMKNHAWCCKLLAEDGMAKIRRVGDKDFLIADLEGGYIDVSDHFVIYADYAKWQDEKKAKYYI